MRVCVSWVLIRSDTKVILSGKCAPCNCECKFPRGPAGEQVEPGCEGQRGECGAPGNLGKDGPAGSPGEQGNKGPKVSFFL